MGIYHQLDRRTDTVIQLDSALAIFRASPRPGYESEYDYFPGEMYPGHVYLNDAELLSAFGSYYTGNVSSDSVDVRPTGVQNIWRVTGNGDIPPILDSIATPVDSLVVLSPKPGDTLSLSSLAVIVSGGPEQRRITLRQQGTRSPVTAYVVGNDTLNLLPSTLVKLGIVPGPVEIEVSRTYSTTRVVAGTFRYDLVFEISDRIHFVLRQ
jgi:hypothetical protein